MQDFVARQQRTRGRIVLWIPGTDHAGIATQLVVEKFYKKTQGISRLDLGQSASPKGV